MKNFLWTISFILFIVTNGYSQDTSSEKLSEEFVSQINEIIETEKNIQYDTGHVKLNENIELRIPHGYKFMNKKDAKHVVEDIWENPEDNSIIGMLVRDSFSLIDLDWAFIVSYENSGYVKDENANDIDYDELLEAMQEGEAEINDERVAAGYPTIHTAGWAAKPYYDSENNILHWAKILEFDQLDTTLNYDVRVLGRKGILSLNAVGAMDQLGDIQKHIPDIIHIAKFGKGHTYSDFDPDADKVAAYTIGGLVAGKILAKAGFFALILKNIKLILIGLIAFFGGFRKKIARLFGKKISDDPIDDDLNSDSNINTEISNQDNS